MCQFDNYNETNPTGLTNLKIIDNKYSQCIAFSNYQIGTFSN
ncbi:hypothetical protein RC62_336 [Flavobacterium aquidurense]|uniref:Uncharacterized protein n=1 Tax=Flavobacterium aquidurense TaxID=362413 RepID=A0A0Q0S9L5_9FLAO|nr:hypothetical protein RC62_336 [Flavobacterium aquidurense]